MALEDVCQFLTIKPNYLLAPWSRVLLEKLTSDFVATPLRKKHMLRITHKLRCFLWRQNNPEVNYSPTRISRRECF
jgi:hypothetical protein